MKVEIKNLGSHDVQSLGDEDLKKIITDGKGKMQPIHSVTGKSVDDVIAYIRTPQKVKSDKGVGCEHNCPRMGRRSLKPFPEEEKHAT